MDLRSVLSELQSDRVRFIQFHHEGAQLLNSNRDTKGHFIETRHILHFPRGCFFNRNFSAACPFRLDPPSARPAVLPVSQTPG